MFESIFFCIGNNTIEVNNERFDLGALTTEILNLPADIYADMRRTLKTAENKRKRYEQAHSLSDWFEANEEYVRLDKQMSQHRIFRLIRQDTEILEQARQFTAQISLFDDDCELTEYDLEVNAQITAYEDYKAHPENYGGEDIVYIESEDGKVTIPICTPQSPIPPEPPEMTRALLIYPGNIKLKWEYYKRFCDGYAMTLNDIESFNYTVSHFIQLFLSKLKNLSRNTYAAALMDFLNRPRSDKFIANPFQSTGLYANSDQVTVRHIPRETEDGSGIYKIYEYYEVQTLQALLKMDFYKALEAGYVIRRCEYCGRYFLLKKGYHTKYCDAPSPNDPKHTCAQLGYHLNGIKEAVGDDPKAQSLQIGRASCRERVCEYV